MSSESAEGGCPACGGSIPNSYVYVVSTCFVCARPVRPSSRYGSSAPVFIFLDVICLLFVLSRRGYCIYWMIVCRLGQTCSLVQCDVTGGRGGRDREKGHG